MRYNLGRDVLFAVMAELVDALDSGSSRGNSVKVQVFLAASHGVVGSRNCYLPFFLQD